MIFNRCPACHGATTNTSTCSERVEDGICDNCIADLKAQDGEYSAYLDNLPLYRKIQRKAAKTVTSVKIAVHQWNAK